MAWEVFESAIETRRREENVFSFAIYLTLFGHVNWRFSRDTFFRSVRRIRASRDPDVIARTCPLNYVETNDPTLFLFFLYKLKPIYSVESCHLK